MFVRKLPYIVSRSIYFGLLSLMLLILFGIGYIVSGDETVGIIAAISSAIFIFCTTVAGTAILIVLFLAYWRSDK